MAARIQDADVTPASEDLAADLETALGPGGVLTDRSDLVRYESGWRYGHGRARLVCRPRTTEQVAAIVSICRGAGVRVQPMGANTGLVAASNPDASGDMVVLSLERLNDRIEVDAVGGTVTVDGGVLLSSLQEALATHGRTFPIDLGADPQIGGMVATNTGGTRLVRYGDVRQNLLGVEVVLPTGEIWSDLSHLRKNNTGLDAKQLFVGTSGAFGIVTAAVLRTWPLPKQVTGALVCVESGEAVLALLAALEPVCGEFLTAFEAMSAAAVGAVLKHGSVERDPFHGTPPRYAVLVELSSSLDSHRLDLEELLSDVLVQHMESESAGIDEVLVGAASDFWHIRHQISESLREEGEVLGLDISVPRSRMAAFTEDVRNRVAALDPMTAMADFGHWGDGGSHLNLLLTGDDIAERKRALQDMVYEVCVTEYGGSYSAEHGIGPHNRAAYERYTSEFVRRVTGSIGESTLGTVGEMI